MKAATPEAVELFRRGAIALAKVEANGMRVDEDYLDKAISKVQKKIKKTEELLQEDLLWRKWTRKFGSQSKLSKRNQLRQILLSEGIEIGNPNKFRASDEESTSMDEEVLGAIDLDFTRNYLKLEKLKKTHGTYLSGIKREVCNGFIHVFFNLNIAISYRSSASEVNLQNMPIRQKEMSKIIRQCFIPRKKGWRITEVDFSGIEVRGAACYNKDPQLIKYIKDPTTDMHRDMASQCYKLDRDLVSKDVRYCAKNMFVFPEFYGSWYKQCAPNLWNAINKLSLKTEDGVPMADHLASVGITKLGNCDTREEPKKGTFEYHIWQTEKDFWNRRFAVYQRWKDSVWRDFQDKGYFQMFTGFVCSGNLNRKQVINYRIQGSSFHCLLMALIEIQRRLKKRKMKTLIVCQIHDSIIGDGPEEESEEFAQICKEVMTVWLPKLWKWIIVPLEIEVEWAPPGMSWHHKAKVEI